MQISNQQRNSEGIDSQVIFNYFCFVAVVLFIMTYRKKRQYELQVIYLLYSQWTVQIFLH